MNGKMLRIVGGAAAVVGMLAAAIGSWVQERQIELTIDEKVMAALYENKEEEETEDEEES